MSDALVDDIADAAAEDADDEEEGEYDAYLDPFENEDHYDYEPCDPFDRWTYDDDDENSDDDDLEVDIWAGFDDLDDSSDDDFMFRPVPQQVIILVYIF